MCLFVMGIRNSIFIAAVRNCRFNSLIVLVTLEYIIVGMQNAGMCALQGERKGQNKYYLPDFDYKKHKSLAGYHGQHPLRERARKLHEGILIIRLVFIALLIW